MFWASARVRIKVRVTVRRVYINSGRHRVKVTLTAKRDCALNETLMQK